MAMNKNLDETPRSAPVQTPHLAPGDEAPPGTPGSGENTCRKCEGSGTVDGKPCPECEGTGYVIVEIGGA